MKVTKGIRKQLFLNTYNNSTIWDYYKEKNYFDVRNIVSDNCSLEQYYVEVENYFDKEYDPHRGLSSFLNSLYWDCKRFEIELTEAYFEFGFISKDEYEESLDRLKEYI